MKIAIVLAVSNYNNPSNNLPASKKDGEIISGILTATKKYEKILTLNGDQSSFKTKELLSNFFIENKGSKIEELFFYYSGHGEFSNDEFYYLLSDFDNKKKNQTSLQNNEIDDLIRTLNPQLVIKVIDACQSGTSYIKESDVLNKYFNETKKGFTKCYFLNSSLSNQSSYQDENLSFFTYSFVQALKEHPTSEIRYKDIIDFILDDFQGNKEQTPFFVIQAEFTEKFCSFTEDLRSFLMGNSSSPKNSKGDEKKGSRILELVKSNAKDYVDKNGALKALDFSKSKFQEILLADDIRELYSLEVIFLEDNNSLPGVKAIGKWLKDNNNEFIARPYYTEEFDPFEGELNRVLSGYELLIEGVPYKAVSIEIKSRFPNLKSFQCNIAVLISKKQISFFYSILQYLEFDWENKTLDTEKISWSYTDSKIANEESILKGIENVNKFVNDKIQTELNAQFGLKSEEDDLPF